MNVGVVTVTYSNRVIYLNKIISRAFLLGIKRCCIVVNGSDKELFSELYSLENLHIIFNDENLGSATAFKQGISYLKTLNDIDYIWLLDDDNLPELDALFQLNQFIKNNSFSIQNDALLSFRPDRPIYLRSILDNNGAGMLKSKNSALGFSIFTKKNQESNYNEKGLSVAPYGGLFFHKKLIDNIGYPDESYFLYGDDFDFSIRIPNSGGKIKLVKDSILIDLEKSFHLKKKRFYETRFHKTNNTSLIFYSVRNNIVFELNHQVSHLIIYITNLFIYSTFVSTLLIITLNLNKSYYFTKGIISGFLKGIKLYKNEN